MRWQLLEDVFPGGNGLAQFHEVAVGIVEVDAEESAGSSVAFHDVRCQWVSTVFDGLFHLVDVLTDQQAEIL